ncbi:MAG: hypothetical protein K2V38_16925, partial [Gemmataceae bacterium]|nr:hypothetical protein [Gemmataceae bacterium]
MSRIANPKWRLLAVAVPALLLAVLVGCGRMEAERARAEAEHAEAVARDEALRAEAERETAERQKKLAEEELGRKFKELTDGEKG